MNVAIIGGGITGLSIAYGLQKQGIKAHVFEAQDRVGGALRSYRQDGFLFENGAHSFTLEEPGVPQLLDQLKLTEELIWADPQSHERLVLHQGQLHPFPQSFEEIWTCSLLSWPAKLRFICEYWKPKGDPNAPESVADFVTRRFGQEFLDKAFGPLVSGVYAGDPKTLSFSHAFPKIHALANEHGSLIKAFLKLRKKAKLQAKSSPSPAHRGRVASFRKGMESLPKALVQSLNPERVYVKTQILSMDLIQKKIRWQQAGSAVKQKKFDAVVMAVNGPALLALPITPSEPLQFAHLLRYAPITLVQLTYPKTALQEPLRGFGFLSAHTCTTPVLGALYPENVFSHRAPPGYTSLTCFIGGARHPDPGAQAGEMAHELLAKVLKIQGPARHIRVHTWGQSHPIAHFGVDHDQTVLKRLEQLDKDLPTVVWAGPYRHPPAVGTCLAAGLKKAKTLAHILQA